jgi:4-carboxymuconolactone decarboxylase
MTKTNDELFDKGLGIRREVLGAKYVDPNMERAKTDDFIGTIQDMVTEYCWGYGWGRDGLDKRTRSMLTITLLTVLGKMTELKAHTRGALHNGVTVDEIKEVLLHATIYAGIPAGVDAFRNAKEAIEAYEKDQG